MRLSLVSVATGWREPVLIDELQAHLGLEAGIQDTALSRMISSARQLFEDETGRQIRDTVWRMHLSRFPKGRDPIDIPKPPLRSVDAITYTDASGAAQTWDAAEWEVVAPAGEFPRHGLVVPSAGHRYPISRWAEGSVVVEFTAGYEAGEVPESVSDAVLTIAAGLFEFREPQVVGSTITESPIFTRVLSRHRLPVMA